MTESRRAKSTKTQRVCRIIRIATVPPSIALLTLTILQIAKPDIFGSVLNYVSAVTFFAILPVLAYPMQPFIPYVKNKGREGQRQLAITMSVIGYILGIACAFFQEVTNQLMALYLSYFLSGMLILLFNRGLKVRASGHACGAAGPIAMLIYLLGAAAIISLCLLILIYWASLTIKRHTWMELIWGSMISVSATAISIFLTSLS